MSGNSEEVAAKLAAKGIESAFKKVTSKVGAAVAGSIAAGATAHAVKTDNTNQRMSSVGFGAELGQRAGKSGKFQTGLDSLKSTNADTTAYDAFSQEAGLESGIIEAVPKTDPLSALGRATIGKELLTVTSNSSILTRLQSKKQGSKVSVNEQASPQEALDVSAVNALPTEGLEGNQSSTVSASIAPTPTPTPTPRRGTKRPFASIFCSEPFAGGGKGSSEYSQLVTPRPGDIEIYSTPPFGLLGQFALIFFVGVIVSLGTWSLLSGKVKR